MFFALPESLLIQLVNTRVHLQSISFGMQHTKKVAFHTLGCKLNFSETSTLARQFGEAGYARVEMDDDPDVLVINTCSVTEQADKKCRNIVSRAVRQNPGVYVAVVGCYAQLKPEAITAIPGVKMVLGSNEKFNLVQRVEQADHSTSVNEVGEIKDVKTFIPSYSSGDRTRTFLKVQDGCNYFCAFCTIPLARGRSRSASIAETLEQAKKAAADGAKEIVLTGVNIGDFGTAQNETLLELCQELQHIEGIERYRISSIEPNLLTDELIHFVSHAKTFMPHFHIPLQSGSDTILQGMRRRYRTDLYRSRVVAIKTRMPHACIGADVITGFPGETDELFEETVQFILSLPISYLHVFTYSERDNTTALRLDGIVPQKIRQQRTIRLRMISDKLRRQFYAEHAGQTRSVLFESAEDEEGRMCGFTDNYIKVTSPFRNELKNQIIDVPLNQQDSDGHFKVILP
jgi:threonylcarbamoyladenosine tRNA methylthiotransferase MtaB